MAERTEHNLVSRRQGHRRVHRHHFNQRVAIMVTRWIGTMWAAYVFAVLAFVALPQAISEVQRGDVLAGVTWLSQSFLQLVLLPILAVGQNVLSETQDARAEADHDTLNEILRRLEDG